MRTADNVLETFMGKKAPVVEGRHVGRLARWLLVPAVWVALGALAPGNAYSANGASVEGGGQASFSYPLQLPPGIAGLAPSLSLAYASGRGNGPLGVGWSLQGLSAITRCAATIAQDGARGAVQYSATDKLCLDGERLIQVDPATGVSLANQLNDAAAVTGTYREYRLEKDNFTRIRAYGASPDGSAPNYFKAWTKAGQIFEYGNTTDSRITSSAGTEVIAWAANKILDTTGNHIRINYNVWLNTYGTGGSAGREWAPSTIEYTATNTQNASNRVHLIYEARPDKSESYHAGRKSVSTQRVKEIRISVNGMVTVVKTYRIGYTVGAISKKSRISSIRECAGTGTNCLPATTFTWYDGAGTGFVAAPTTFDGTSKFGIAQIELQNNSNNLGFLQGDFDGDGRTDIIRWHDNAANNQLWWSMGDGGFTKAANFNLTNVAIGRGSSCAYSIVTDLNGDGKADILVVGAPYGADGTGIGLGAGCGDLGSSSIWIKPYLSNGDGTFTQVQPGGTSAMIPRVGRMIVESFNESTSWKVGEKFMIADFTGDGIPDLLITRRSDDPYAPLPVQLSPDCPSSQWTCFFKGNGNGTFVMVPTNLSATSAYGEFPTRSGLMGGYLDQRETADVDGDGLTDLTTSAYWRSRGDGNFDQLQGAACLGVGDILDINGDGKDDCARLDPGQLAYGTPLTISPSAGTSYLGQSTLATTDFYVQGSASIFAGINSCSPETSTIWCAQFRRDQGRFIAADFNGDGYSDLLFVSNNLGSQAPNALYLGNGAGGFSEDVTFPLRLTSLNNLSGRSLAVTDITGRGSLEFLSVDRTMANNRLYIRSDARPVDTLVQVADGLGAVTEFSYKPLSDRTVHTMATGAVFPTVDATPPIWVVSEVKKPNGIGGVVSSTLQYHGFRAHAHGRGQLGFKRVEQTSPAPNGTLIVDRREMRQDYPFTGMPSRVAKYVAATGLASPLRDVTTTYVDSALVGEDCPLTIPNGAPRLARVVVRSVAESGFDLNGAGLPSTTSTMVYNCFGDATNVTATTTATVAGQQQTYSKVTASTYLPAETNADNWFLGRLQRTTVTNNTPDTWLTTSSGTAPLRDAHQGVSPSLAVTPNPVSVSFTSSGNNSTTATASMTTLDTPPAYQWRRVSGSRISLSNSTSATATFSATMSWSEDFTEQFEVTATDSVGVARTASVPVRFTTPPQLIANTSATTLSLSQTGPGPSSGTINGSAAGGVPPYDYSWARSGPGSRVSVSGQTTGSFSATLGWGENISETFNLTVRDSANNTATKSVTVTAVTPPTLAITQPSSALSVNRAGPGNAILDVTAQATGGTPPYSFAWARRTGTRFTFNPTGATNPFTAAVNWAEDFTEEFQVTVTDSAGRSVAPRIFTIRATTPSTLVVSATPVDITLNRLTNGPAQTTSNASATGGNGGYSYAWALNSGSSRISVSGQQLGTFTANLGWNEDISAVFRVTATDQQGFAGFKDVNVRMKTPIQPAVGLSSTTLALARTSNAVVSGSVTATGSGGTPNYSYSWANISGSRVSIANPTSASPTFSVTLAWGESFSETMRVTMTDSGGNTVTANVVVTASAPAAPSVTVTPPAVSLNRTSPGLAEADATPVGAGGVPNYDYVWARTQGSRISVSGANPARFSVNLGWNESLSETFKVTMTDAAGNLAERSVTVTATSPPPVSVALQTSPLNLSRNNPGTVSGNVSVTGAGGTGPYTYHWTRLTGSRISFGATGSPNTFSASVNMGESFSETFSVVARDVYNNESPPVTLTVNVSTPPPLTLSTNTASLSGLSSCEYPPKTIGSVLLTTTGGAGGNTIAWVGSGTYANNFQHTGGMNPTFTWIGPYDFPSATFTATIRDSANNTASVNITVQYTMQWAGCGA